jgi:HlyD family secretion protein
MINRFLLPWGLAALAAGVLCGCSRASASDDEESAVKPVVEVSVEAAATGDVRDTLDVTGSLSPLAGAEAKVAPLAAGRVREVFVKLGDSVHKGQPLATLDPAGTAGQLEQAAAAVRVSEATLSQARANLTSQLRSQVAAVQQAEINLEAQKVALVKLRAGSRPQEIAQAQAGVASAEAAETNALQNLSRSHTLYSEGLLARKDLEDAEMQEKTAHAALESAKQALSLVKQGSRAEDIRAGEVAVRLAEKQLEAARAQYVQNAAKKEDVRIAAAQLQSARGALSSTQAQARSLTIVSPVSGTVVSVGVNPGESVDVTAGIATVVDLSRVRVLLNVPADKASAITKGMPVEFTVEGGGSYAATVTVVTRAVDSNSNTVVVEALAQNPDRRLRDDGFVKATVFTAVHRGVVTVPASALVEKDGKTTVFVAGSDGVAHAKEVVVGAREGARVEIKSGLHSGDKVVTTGAYEMDDGTQIKLAK